MTWPPIDYDCKLCMCRYPRKQQCECSHYHLYTYYEKCKEFTVDPVNTILKDYRLEMEDKRKKEWSNYQEKRHRRFCKKRHAIKMAPVLSELMLLPPSLSSRFMGGQEYRKMLEHFNNCCVLYSLEKAT